MKGIPFKTRCMVGEAYPVSPDDPVVATRNADVGVHRAAVREWAKRQGVRLKDEYYVQPLHKGVWYELSGYEIRSFNYTEEARA